MEWVIKDNFLGSAFFDASASAFIMPELLKRISHQKEEADEKFANAGHDNPSPLPKPSASTRHQGAALGPEWLAKSKLLDEVPISVKESEGRLLIHYEQEIRDMREGTMGSWIKIDDSNSKLRTEDWKSKSGAPTAISPDIHIGHEYPLYVRTCKNVVIACDFLISATGVYPCTAFVGPEFVRGRSATSDSFLSSSAAHRVTSGSGSDRSPTDSDFARSCHATSSEVHDGALVVNELMQTSVKGVYAAGDCCLYRPDRPGIGTGASPSGIEDSALEDALAGKHWIQMRLWTQARSSGIYAAQCMCGQQDSLGGDFFFEIFAHVTRFFGFKVRALYCCDTVLYPLSMISRESDMIIES